MPEVDIDGIAPRRATSGQSCAIAAALLAFSGGWPAQAKQEPLWEFGLGAGAIAFEDYRGSNTTHAYPLPVPYFRYNGKFLKADRDGVRGTLFNQNWLEINVSFNLTTPVRTDRAALRHRRCAHAHDLIVAPAIEGSHRVRSLLRSVSEEK